MTSSLFPRWPARPLACSLLLALLALTVLAVPALAQRGLVAGKITNAGSGLPVEAAQLRFVDGPTATGGLTDAAGTFRFQLEPGTYAVVVERMGFRPVRFNGIRVASGQTTTYDLPLTPVALSLDPVVVSVERVEQASSAAPATTAVIGATEIDERTVTTPAEYLRDAPGVDILTTGVGTSYLAVRGFGGLFSASLRTLTDHRIANLPSIDANMLHLLPANSEDIDRMEVVLGPASALYGPNTGAGVVHVLTKSPLDRQGTTVSLAAGERSAVQGEFRSAFLLADNLGFKISGQYLQATDWEYVDPVEEAARIQAETNPATCIASLQLRGLDAAAAGASCARVGHRLPDTRKWGVEARADYRFAEDGTAVLTYGKSSTTGVSTSALSAYQAEDWTYEFFQARVNKGRLFGQAYLNRNEAGSTYALRDGAALIDHSTLFAVQARHGLALWEKEELTYGVDVGATRPATDGATYGSHEDHDGVTEVGGYLQSRTSLTDRLELVLAGRVDHHDVLPRVLYSPRAALVFQPRPEQAFRVTYNRGYWTPRTGTFFWDAPGGAAPGPLGSLGYTVRLHGTDRDGFSFRNADGSLKGVRSPFNPGGPGTVIPADAAVLWPLAVGAAAQIAAAQGTPLPASVVQLLQSLRPTSGNIGLTLYNVNSGKTSSLPQGQVPDVPGVRESLTETYEVGWQGTIRNRARLAVDAYYRKSKNGYLMRVVTPMVLLNGQEVGAFITVPIVTALTQQLMAAGVPAAQAQQMAQQQAATLVPQLATAIASIPVGVVSTEEIPTNGADLVASYLNHGDYDLWGADLALTWLVDDRWTVTGTYSFVSDDWFMTGESYGQPEYRSLNAPRNKATLGVAYRDVGAGFNADARLRLTGSFPVQDGAFVGTKCIPDAPASVFQEECIGGYALVDVNVGYKIPNTQATAQLTVGNLFNTAYRNWVGVPTVGRLAMLRMKWDLF